MSLTKDIVDHNATETRDIRPATYLRPRGETLAVIQISGCDSESIVPTGGPTFSRGAGINIAAQSGDPSRLSVLTVTPAEGQGAAAFPSPDETPVVLSGSPVVNFVSPEVWPIGSSQSFLIGRGFSEVPLDVFAVTNAEEGQELAPLIVLSAVQWISDPNGAGLEGDFDGLTVVRVDVNVAASAIVGSVGGISVLRSTEEVD